MRFTSKRTKAVSRPGQQVQRKVQKAGRKIAPVAKARRPYTTSDPMLKSTGDVIRVSHREFVQDVTGQTAFTALSFPINPGRDTLFTWLPDLASRYERYQFGRLRFLYEPRCSTATAGSVILAVDYDPLDAAPSSKQDVYAYHHSAQSSPWDECVLTVDPAILVNRGTLFSRTGAAPSGSDLKTYDLGNLWLCVSGFAGAAVCGELFVEYEVTLKIPQVASNVQSGTLSGQTGIDATHQLGTNLTSLTGLLDVTVDATTFTFNQNFYGSVAVNVTGTVVTALVHTGTATAASSYLTINGGATGATATVVVDAKRGQTWIPTWTATTVTANGFIFAPRF